MEDKIRRRGYSLPFLAYLFDKYKKKECFNQDINGQLKIENLVFCDMFHAVNL
jgi:hypothetical protein